MFDNEKIRKVVWDSLVDNLCEGQEQYSAIIEDVTETLWDKLNIIVNQTDVEFLVDSMWNEAEAHAKKLNRLAEESYYERQGALADAVAGRW